MVNQQITAAWGRELAAWLRTDNVFRVLGGAREEGVLCDWQAGGCRLLAECLLKPLQQAFPQTEFELRMMNARGIPQHVMICATDKTILRVIFIDGDGVSTGGEMIDRWTEELREECNFADYDETVLDIFGITSPQSKRKLFTDLLAQSNLYTFAADPVSTNIAGIVSIFTQLGKNLYGDGSWPCDVGAVVLAHLADEYQINRAIIQGTYLHPNAQSYNRTTGEIALSSQGEEPIKEAHTWVVLTDQSGEWIIDPNGELRGEPRAQRRNHRDGNSRGWNSCYLPFPVGHEFIELAPDISIQTLLNENWDIRLTEAIERLKHGAPREVEVQILPPVNWSRPRLQNIESHRIYADVSLSPAVMLKLI